MCVRFKLVTIYQKYSISRKLERRANFWKIAAIFSGLICFKHTKHTVFIGITVFITKIQYCNWICQFWCAYEFLVNNIFIRILFCLFEFSEKSHIKSLIYFLLDSMRTFRIFLMKTLNRYFHPILNVMWLTLGHVF